MLQAFADQLSPALKMFDLNVAEKAPEQANVGVIQAFYEALARGDFDATHYYLWDEIEFELYGVEPLPYLIKAKGLGEVMVGLRQNLASTEWTTINIETLVAQGEQVVLIVTEAGHYRQTKDPFHRRSVLEYHLYQQKLLRFRGWTFPL